MPLNAPIDVRVNQIRYRAAGINSYQLVLPDGGALPAFTAGAHVEVHLPNGMMRPYSLHNCQDDTSSYEISVKREAGGAGASRYLHDDLRVGDVVRISSPINHFELVENESRYLLIGAGIGMTPIIAMARRLQKLGAAYALHYCGRSREQLAFLGDAEAICGSRLHLHIDGGDPAAGLDVSGLLAQTPAETQIYCCGPSGLNAAVWAAAPDRRKKFVHLENFTPASQPAPAPSGARLEVELIGSGEVIAIPDDTSVLAALRAHGHIVESSCEAGTCGACKTKLVDGDVEHLDFVLADDEQKDWMIVCVSRPRSGRIKLDLS